MIFFENSFILLTVLLVVFGLKDAITDKPYIVQNFNFNEFVANVLHDNIDMIIFVL